MRDGGSSESALYHLRTDCSNVLYWLHETDKIGTEGVIIVQFQLRVKLWSNKVKRSVLYLAIQLDGGFALGYKMKGNPNWAKNSPVFSHDLLPSINPRANSERIFAGIYSLGNALCTPVF